MKLLDNKDLPVGWITVRYIYLRIFFFLIFTLAAGIIIYIFLSRHPKKKDEEAAGKHGASAATSPQHGNAEEITGTASVADLDGDVRLRDAAGIWSVATPD